MWEWPKDFINGQPPLGSWQATSHPAPNGGRSDLDRGRAEDHCAAPGHQGLEAAAHHPEIDKSRWGRDVPPTEKARKALDSACPKEEPIKSFKKKNRLMKNQAVFLVQRRGLEPPSQLRRQHLKLVCLPVPPPLR